MPSAAASALSPQLRDLADAIGDFRRSAAPENDAGLLQRIVDVLRDEPLKGFLEHTLPLISFDEWWGPRYAQRGGWAIAWPAERTERVALQVGCCLHLAGDGHDRLFQHTYDHYANGSRKISDAYRAFTDQFLQPLARDIEKLTEQRPLGAPVNEALRHRPTSSDVLLDGLLRDACEAFRDPAPAKRYEGLRALWDAFERAKTVHPTQDKKVGAEALLLAASSDDAVRELLRAEMKALTEVGNHFHIRHFETNRQPIADPAHIDYLFLRMLALMQVLLRPSSREKAG